MAISISPMTPEDLDFAVSMTDAENWGYLRSDLVRLLSLAPDGCFVARGALRRIGIITTTQHGDYGFMGTLIVMKNHRGSGIGKGLFERALMHLRSRSVRTIELDGVFPAVNLYRRLGFLDKQLSLRFHRKPAEAISPASSPLSVTLGDLLHFDREQIGIDRSAVLSRLYEDFRDSILVMGDDQIRGYAIVRPREGGAMAIGPLVAVTTQNAVDLLRIVVNRYHDKPLSIGVPEIKVEFARTLIAEGFVYRLPSVRMYFGARLEIEEHMFGIISPEKG